MQECGTTFFKKEQNGRHDGNFDSALAIDESMLDEISRD